MSLSGDAYTLGVRLTGDISSLRQELQQGTQVISSFATASQEAMNRAAAAMDRAAGAMTTSAQRTARATEAPQKTLPRTASAFDDYMRRATRAQDEVARTSEQTSQRTSRSLNTVGSSLARLTGYAGFGLLARQVWTTGMGFHEFTQNTEVALRTLLGTKEAARGFLDEILAFAKETPYAFTDLTSQAQKLITYGFQTEQIIPILRATGDAATAMGKGTEGVERLTRALGQVQAAGRLRSQELLQLSEVGVNGLAILANQAGMTTAEFQEMVTAGLVPAEEAVAGLVKGINEGTDGVNGQTAAFGGLMKEIKGSGGITATMDATRTSIRNASAAVTDSLVPAFTGFLGVSQDALGVVERTANVFGGLPVPVQNSALAFAATAAAMKLLNVQGRATTVWGAFSGHLATSRLRAQALTMEVGRLRAVMGTVRASAGAAGSALLGAFGGPVGLAIAGAVAAVSAFASAQEAANARVETFRATLDEVGAVTNETLSSINEALSRDRGDWIDGIFGKDPESLIDRAQKFGLAVEDLQGYILGEADAVSRVNEATSDYVNAAPLIDGKRKEARFAVSELVGGLDQEANALTAAEKIALQKARADEASTDATDGQTEAVKRSTLAIEEWGEEQQKAIDAAAEAARKAFSPNLGAMSLDLTTDDDVAKARDRVEEATRRLRDAEDDRAEKLGKDKLTAKERTQAEESVADARKALQEVTEELGQTEERTDPVKQYREKVQGILDASKTFVSDVQALADQGLNTIDLQEIINAGPEGSADTRKALLGDPSTIDFTNEARETIEALTAEVERQSRLTEAGMQGAGRNLGGELGLGMRIAAAEGSADTIADLAASLGEDPDRIYQVGRDLGLAFLDGMKDAGAFQRSMRFHADGSFDAGPGTNVGFANGGIYPGYTPGRDIGYIGVSGGEAIMRPEWTKAVGPAAVHRWNALARSGGAGAVQAEMRRYLGGFANGGVAPQVVTVPVSSTHENNVPMTFPNAVFTDPDAARRYGLRARARANWTGGTRAH